MKKICKNVIKCLGLAYLVVVLIPYANIFGSAGRDVIIKGIEAGGDITTNTQANSTVYSCAGTGPCNYSSNAVGDLKEIDVPISTPTHTLRPITVKRKILLVLPAIGNQVLFKFAFTQPFSSDSLDMAIVGVPMEILLVGSEPDAEAIKLRADTQSMVKIYRRMPGEGLWTEAATLVSNVTDTDQLLPATIVLDPDGRAEFVTNEGKPEELFLGKAILG